MSSGDRLVAVTWRHTANGRSTVASRNRGL